jgi:hypothetical protein
MKFAEFRTADLSSRHLTKSDVHRLTDLEPKTDHQDQRVVIAPFDEGWFVEVGDEWLASWTQETNESIRDYYAKLGFSPQFIRIVEAVQAEGIAYVRFHADTELTEGLEVY